MFKQPSTQKKNKCSELIFVKLFLNWNTFNSLSGHTFLGYNTELNIQYKFDSFVKTWCIGDNYAMIVIKI